MGFLRVRNILAFRLADLHDKGGVGTLLNRIDRLLSRPRPTRDGNNSHVDTTEMTLR